MVSNGGMKMKRRRGERGEEDLMRGAEYLHRKQLISGPGVLVHKSAYSEKVYNYMMSYTSFI